MYQGILFDLDGTLLETADDIAAAVNTALLAHDYPSVSLEQVKVWIGNGVDILLTRACLQKMDVALSDNPNLTSLRAEFDQAYHACLGAQSYLYEGVELAIADWHAKGISLGCVTNKPRAFTLLLLEAAGLLSKLDVVVAGDDLPERKPAATPILHAAQTLAIRPELLLMVGDSANDVLSARRAGVAVVAMSYGYNHGLPASSLDADQVFDDFSTLYQWVERQNINH